MESYLGPLPAAGAAAGEEAGGSATVEGVLMLRVYTSHGRHAAFGGLGGGGLGGGEGGSGLGGGGGGGGLGGGGLGGSGGALYTVQHARADGGGGAELEDAGQPTEPKHAVPRAVLPLAATTSAEPPGSAPHRPALPLNTKLTC